MELLFIGVDGIFRRPIERSQLLGLNNLRITLDSYADVVPILVTHRPPSFLEPLVALLGRNKQDIPWIAYGGNSLFTPSSLTTTATPEAPPSSSILGHAADIIIQNQGEAVRGVSVWASEEIDLPLFSAASFRVSQSDAPSNIQAVSNYSSPSRGFGAIADAVSMLRFVRSSPLSTEETIHKLSCGADRGAHPKKTVLAGTA